MKIAKVSRRLNLDSILSQYFYWFCSEL